MKRAVAVLAFLALALPAGAAAHATLIRTAPANGAVLAQAPREVRAVFDDRVHTGSGNAAVSNETSASVLGGPAVARGDVLTLPLRAGLRDGDYSVRWSIVSDDGHREQGVLAFAVGSSGGVAPHSVLGAAAPLTWSDILLRTLYYFGLLAAGGATVFGLLTRTLLGEALRRPLAQLLFFALLAVFLGGSGIEHAAAPGTRFVLVLRVALVIALAGGAAAALAPTVPALLPVAGAASLLLVLGPTLSGHALDRTQPQLLSVPADLAHLASASIWLGGLLALVYVVPRATGDAAVRTAVARRFSTLALGSVAALGATGILRAVGELSAVHQVWSTSYGRALIAKTVLFVPLLGIGWLNRTVLISAFARLRRSALVELTVLLGIVIAVAILTELRPGTDVSRVAAAAPLRAAQPPVLPPRSAVVDARELGNLGVAVARTPGKATVTLIGQDGTGVSGRTVLVDGARTSGCGAGCYAAPAAPGALRISVDGRMLTFSLPESAPDARALLRDVTKNYRAAKTIVFDEVLASSPRNAQRTRFTVVAPDRLSYVIRGGPAAVVIGAQRWDRDSPGARWLRSQQTPLEVTQPYWRTPTNVHLVAPGVLTFLDRQVPAWFRVELSGKLPSTMHMTAAAHFMVDRYVGFDVPADVSPPPSR